MSESFASQYRGRHAPSDALWWSTHPDEVAPSGAQPAGRVFDRLVELIGTGDPAFTDAILGLKTAILDSDDRAADTAFARCEVLERTLSSEPAAVSRAS